MRVRENDFGVNITLEESQKKPGAYYASGAEYVVEAALAKGFKSISVTIDPQYGVQLNFNKPFKKQETPV